MLQFNTPSQETLKISRAECVSLLLVAANKLRKWTEEVKKLSSNARLSSAKPVSPPPLHFPTYQEPAESSGSAVTKQSCFATLATLVERLSQSHY